MSWPISQDYNEAIQDPHNSFSDAELKSGEVVANALGIPMPRSGNFADVYEVRCPNGSRWAVKCFTREVAGLRERYAEISKYLHLANLPFMVDFKYLEQGIRIRGQWYPILKMQWVEGFVLNEFVRDNLDKKPILNALGQIWLRMGKRLREANLAHCDLQHGNVLFVPGSTANSLAVKLIDYDGMCVPALLGSKSGELGHPAFQHPERLRTGAYNQEVDRFSLLGIAAALRCLSVGGRSLWDKYDNGDNLLFRPADLQKPNESPLFQELLAIGDTQARMLVKELQNACLGPLDGVPLLTDLILEAKPVGKVTKTVTASSLAVARPAGAQASDWNFGDEEAGSAVIKKRRKSRGMPLWAWGTLVGTAAMVLLTIGVGLALFHSKEPPKSEGTPAAQNKPKIAPSKPPAKRPDPDDPPPPATNPDNPPPTSREIQTQTVELGPARALLERVREAVRAKRTTATRKLGTGRNAYEEVPEEGALLIGFELTYGRYGNNPTVTTLRPIFLTRDGRVMGKLHGMPGANLTRVEAKPGYAVGAVTVKAGLGVDGMSLTFMEIGETGLNPSRAYESEWLGGLGGDAKTKLAGSGAPVVGIFGATAEGRNTFNGLGLVTTPDTEASPLPSLAWDKPLDPDGDCRFREDAGKLTISLPDKKVHDLVAEVGKTNAPRLLRDVTGDFVAEVRIGGDFSGDSVLLAGLFLTVDDKTYLRLERGRFAGGAHCFWELRRDGKRDAKSAIDPVPAFEGYLRLERRGSTLIGSHGTDGQNWTELTSYEIDLPLKVKIGVAAVSTSAAFAPTFERFRLRLGVGPMVRIDSWLPPSTVDLNKPALPRRGNARIPVPPTEQIDIVRKDIRNKYKAAYESGNTNDAMTALFNDLNQSRNDSPRRFALLCEIRDKAAENNIRNGLRQARLLTVEFEVDALDAMCDAYEHSLRTLRPQPAEFLAAGLPLIDEAIGKENYDVLRRVVKIVEQAANSLPPNAEKRLLAAPVLTLAKRVQQEYAKLQSERKTLAATPDDPKANLALGKYHCVWRGDWGEGLPMLAQGSDATLKALAEKDIANPDEPAAEIALAKEWLKYATKVSGVKPLRSACEKRGYYWYQMAATRLKGDKLRETQRALDVLSKNNGLQTPWWPFGIYENVKYDGDTLLLNPPFGFKTREYYSGPIEITAMVRSTSSDVNITIGGGGRLVFGHDPFTKKDRLQVYHPDRNPESLGTPVKVRELELPAKRQYILRWLVASSGMKVWLDDKLLLDESGDGYNLDDKYTVSLSANSSPIELKWATIRRVSEK